MNYACINLQLFINYTKLITNARELGMCVRMTWKHLRFWELTQQQSQLSLTFELTDNHKLSKMKHGTKIWWWKVFYNKSFVTALSSKFFIKLCCWTIFQIFTFQHFINGGSTTIRSELQAATTIKLIQSQFMRIFNAIQAALLTVQFTCQMNTPNSWFMGF